MTNTSIFLHITHSSSLWFKKFDPGARLGYHEIKHGSPSVIVRSPHFTEGLIVIQTKKKVFNFRQFMFPFEQLGFDELFHKLQLVELFNKNGADVFTQSKFSVKSGYKPQDSGSPRKFRVTLATELPLL